MRRRALANYTRTLQERNKRLEEITARLQLTVSLVRERHERVRSVLSREAIARDVHLRVNRSLEALEGFVRLLRESQVSSDTLEEAVRDPAIPSSIFDRERKASISDLVQSAQRRLIQETEFINIAAHELRTPIMPILINAELLKSELQGAGSEEVDTIVRNSQRLKNLAENILNVAAIEGNTMRMSMERFDLNLVIRQTVEEKKYALGNRDLRLLFVSQSEELQVVADSARIGQVVSNLLDNAIKFTNEGEILVTSAKIDDEVSVSVSDSGPGIDPALFPILFSKFAAKSQKGTGLGLFICRKIIEAHGGKITARNDAKYKGSGATFAFTIPVGIPGPQ